MSYLYSFLTHRVSEIFKILRLLISIFAYQATFSGFKYVKNLAYNPKPYRGRSI